MSLTFAMTTGAVITAGLGLSPERSTDTVDCLRSIAFTGETKSEYKSTPPSCGEKSKEEGGERRWGADGEGRDKRVGHNYTTLSNVKQQRQVQAQKLQRARLKRGRRKGTKIREGETERRRVERRKM